jgi:ribosome-binding ATPase YchF (GTP1/OBG family)
LVLKTSYKFRIFINAFAFVSLQKNMALNCGIIGITNTGKTTLFNCISNTRAESSSFAFSSNKSNLGIISVPDPRLEKLSEIVQPQKTTQATVEIVDIPGLTRGSSHGEGIGNQFLGDIRNTDALIHVLRCFDDDQLPHIEGTVDPVRDMEILDLELQVKDLESVEKRMEKLEKAARAGEKDAKKGLEILGAVKEHLESFQSVRTADIDSGDKKYFYDLFLLTAKPVMFVCNVDEASALSGNAYVDRVREALVGQENEILVIAAGLESDIAELEDPDMLNLISFFTAGPKEVRAWTTRRGSTAPQAAGTIHSDMERGFIRAEVIKFQDYLDLGSESACRDVGKLAVEGKQYIVIDGDVIYVRFNV